MTPTVEMYENFPWLKEDAAAQQKSGCSKDIQSKCLYTAQGDFICEKDMGFKGVPNAKVTDNKGVATTAHPIS
jgi:hypothetical protein